MVDYNLQRFLDAQQGDYERAPCRSKKRAEVFLIGFGIYFLN